MLSNVLLLLLLVAFSIQADEYIWSGSSSGCGDRLVECFENANDGDTIFNCHFN
jgi:hypothetical protein